MTTKKLLNVKTGDYESLLRSARNDRRMPVLLLALALFAGAGLHAQVTIGGLENPKNGAILDLNSTVKGGLLLSNVQLDNLLEIPSDFPGIEDGTNAATLKEGMKGAMIYNINSNTCIGAHVWNGEYWERIASKKTPVPAEGTTLSSNSANRMAGEEIIFTAASGAKTYKWYESENGAPYEYLGITTANTFSKAFSPGACKVKVLMDNCHSLEKSNEVSFAPAALSPNFGSTDGGNIIYIYGDFPYAATSEYVPDDLAAHFDGINNLGLGDKLHSLNADKWVDLKSGFELPRYSAGTGQWLSNGFQASNDSYSFYSDTFPPTFPAGTDPRTIEVIFRTPDVMFTQQIDVQRVIFLYGGSGGGHIFGIGYRGRSSSYLSKPDGCSPENRWIFYAVMGNANNLVTCLSSTPSLEEANTINTVTSTYANSILDEQKTNSYINNVPAEVLGRMGDALDTRQGPLRIGQNLSGSTFLSVRLYNRVLNSLEIAHNAELDQIRYLAPPTVTIDGNPCTEVVVLSPHFLMCTVPEGTSGPGKKDVEVVSNGLISTYTQAYEYVDNDTGFYVTSILPIIAPVAGGVTLTLTGNRLNEITGITVGGKDCTNLVSNPNECTCTLPANPAGETDITITAGATVYRFAKVFEYKN